MPPVLACCVFALLLSIPAVSLADDAIAASAANAPSREVKKRSPWAAQTTPKAGAPHAIGEYSAGCLQGAQALPLRGTGYEVMHPSRVRYFGHPTLVDFLQKLGKALEANAIAPMLIGDLSQPRGGRASGGHASHQSGLDVDVWFWHPKPKKARPLSDQEREAMSAPTVLDGKAQSIKPQWVARVRELLRLTSQDARVQRVFVHPIIKRQLCTEVTGERAWLSKLRPWYGHDDHMHVRLACPKDSTDCVPQAQQAAGDGCEEIDWWFSEDARKDREDARKEYRTKVVTAPKLPARCAEVLK